MAPRVDDGGHHGSQDAGPAQGYRRQDSGPEGRNPLSQQLVECAQALPFNGYMGQLAVGAWLGDAFVGDPQPDVAHAAEALVEGQVDGHRVPQRGTRAADVAGMLGLLLVPALEE